MNRHASSSDPPQPLGDPDGCTPPRRKYSGNNADKQCGGNLLPPSDSWIRIKELLSGQQRITATFKQRDGRTLNIRKPTVAEKPLDDIYNKLQISN